MQALELDNGSTADNLRARSGGSGTDTVELHYGSSLTNSLIQNTGTGAAVNSVFRTTLPAVIQRDTLDAPGGIAVSVGNGAAGMSLVIQDSTLNGVQGLNHTSGLPIPVLIQRSRINSSAIGINWGSVTADQHFSVSDSVIRMTGNGSAAISMSSFGDASTLTLIQDTIDGSDTTGSSSGVNVGPGKQTPPTPNVAHVSDSIVRGFAKDLLAQGSGSPGIPGGLITVARSDFATQLGAPPSGAGQPGSIGFGSGNLNVDPLFQDRAGGNYTPSPGSPVIDAAGADPIDAVNQESSTDLLGVPRIVDGNGDGAAARDMGAVEFVPSPPVPGTTTGAAGFRARLKGGRTLPVFPPGVLKLPVDCEGPAGGSCAVTVVVRSAKPLSAAATASKKRKPKILTVGRGHRRIAAGRSAVITVKLSKKARRLFRRGVLRKVKITAAVAQAGAATQRSQRTYSLKAAPRKKKRR